MSDVDVLVVGAGPAGASAAVWARRAGLEVMLVDRAAPGRDKCCGDGLTALALRELECLSLRPERLDSWMGVDAAYVRTPRGRVIRLPLPAERGQFAAVCRRTELDAALVELAAAAGVDVRLGIAFDGFEDSGERANTASIRLSDGSHTQARFVVAADGVYSSVRKALGIGPHRYRGDWHAFRGYLTASGDAARDMWVWFEPDLLPGYAWSFPLGDGRVNVGFGVPRSSGRQDSSNGTGTLAGSEIAAVWASLTERCHIARVLGSHETDGPTRAWPIPARLGDIELAQGRTLLCGDAAAAADPLTGEGIGQALQMGRMAASAIARGGPPHSVTARYVRDAHAEFTLDHGLARSLSRVLAHERLAELALGAVDLSGWTRRQFARWMFEDYPRAAVATPRRWHQGMAKPQGAYGPRTQPVAVDAISSPS
ncbi:geranylgeranyl reductase family protein [Candidatus Poriferisodalis sp.]|uniref:geranylgeranyl reductase family protein n=1 Tax=Candidatus Poriferisodalis sp. TaxID=3101277 RepID=UPI003B52CC3C